MLPNNNPIKSQSAFSFQDFFAKGEKARLNDISYNSRVLEASNKQLKRAYLILNQLCEEEKKEEEKKAETSKFQAQVIRYNSESLFEDRDAKNNKPLDNAQVKVVAEDCLELVARLRTEHPEAKIALLNMANLEVVAGGFFVGALAQEERICQATTLIAHLLYYANQHQGNRANSESQSQVRPHYGFTTSGEYSFAQEDVLYSEGFIIRDPQTNEPLPEKQHIPVSFITTAALISHQRLENPPGKPYRYMQKNGEVKQISHQEAEEYYLKVIRTQLRVAISNGNTIYVAGAIGCGVFNNHPAFISRCFKTVLQEPEFLNKIQVYFAILGGPTDNLAVFKETFKDPLTLTDNINQPSSQEELSKVIKKSFVAAIGIALLFVASGVGAFFLAVMLLSNPPGWVIALSTASGVLLGGVFSLGIEKIASRRYVSQKSIHSSTAYTEKCLSSLAPNSVAPSRPIEPAAFSQPCLPTSKITAPTPATVPATSPPGNYSLQK